MFTRVNASSPAPAWAGKMHTQQQISFETSITIIKYIVQKTYQQVHTNRVIPPEDNQQVYTIRQHPTGCYQKLTYTGLLPTGLYQHYWTHAALLLVLIGFAGDRFERLNHV